LPPIIAAVSASPLPASGPIVVRFAEPLVEEASVGAALAVSPFTFIPELRGDSVWRDRRTLEFRPAAPLSAGQHVVVSLDLEQLGAGPGPATCSFAVTTEPRRFDLTLGALEAAGPQAFSLVGEVATNADIAPADVEDALQVDLAGARTSVAWRHGDDGRTHGFTITGIERGATGAAMLANLTVVRQGMGRFYGSLGADACIVEVHENVAESADPDTFRVSGQGRCEAPIEAIAREGEIRVAPFEFTGKAYWPEGED
jgi:hypothetical protein